MFRRALLVVALALAWFAPPAQAQSVNLLTNASFEQGSARGWSAYGGGPVDVGSVQSSVAREGASVGYAQTSQSGHSMYQDVSTAVLANRSYSLSMWVRSANGQPIEGTLALSGILNTATEATGTVFTAGGEWKLISASVNTTRIHDALRAQVYLNTTGQRLLVDGAQLFDTALNNSSWELNSWAGWAVEGSSGTVPLADGRDGGIAGVVNLPAGNSFYQDFYTGLTAGQSYTFSVWLRSQTGQPVNVMAAAWGIGAGGQEAGTTGVIVGGAWTLVTATVIPTRGDHTILRGQVYVNTAGVPLQADGAQLTTNGLANASFDQGFSRWDGFPRGALSASTVTNASAAREGAAYGAVRTDAAGRSFVQDVAVSTAAGASRTFSIWLRSPTAARGSVALTGTGGSDERTATGFSVGPRWTLVSAPLDASVTHSGLRAEVVLDTPGAELDVDGASLSAGNARDDAQLGPLPVDPGGGGGGGGGGSPAPLPDADGDGVADASDLCRTQAGTANRRGCPRGLTNDTSIAYRRSGKGIRVVRYYVEATKGARVVVTCSKGCRKTVTKGKGAKRVRITRLTNRRLTSGARVTVTVSMPGRLTTKVVDRVRKGRRVSGRRHCYTPGIKAAVTC